MNKRIWRGLFVLLVIIVGAAGLGVALCMQAVAGQAPVPKTLDRDLEPVVVTGTVVSALVGFPTDQLFVYAYSGGGWMQIPAQVDEVTAAGAYTATEDGLLDANDEIIFMAKDLGDQAPSTTPITGSLRISAGWYEIEVTDPVSPARKGWAYLVHSGVLTQAFAADYVDFDPASHRINGEAFSLGFATPHPWADHLALGGSGVNILDRTKMRLFCQKRLLYPETWLCPYSEEQGRSLEDDLIKDGPVRVVVRAGRVLAYGSMAAWTTPIDLPWYLAGDIRFSMDFNPTVSGATYYNAVVPGGVTVDGMADSVPDEPFSAWWQLATDTGTLIQVADTAPIGGAPRNYYEDDAAVDGSDTGDQRRYGDTGVYIATPRLAFSYRFSVYALPGTQPNVGAAYEAFFRQPLSVKAHLFGDFRPNRIYLPLALRQSTG
jgi:hypothetical protein